MKRSTVVAFAVLVALVGLMYWLDRDDGPDAAVDRVFEVGEDEIDRVEIRPLAGEAVVIERDGESFRLVAPLEAATDETEVDLVLSNLTTMTSVRSFAREDGADLTDYGLDAPTLEVRFVADGGEHEIRFGKDTLTGTNQYAERDGSDEVLVVGNHLARNLGKSAWELRDKAIFHLPDDAEPEHVTITRADDVVELIADDGVWMTARPPRSRVDRFEVTGMVARFRRAEMLDLLDGVSIDTPWLTLDVSFRGDVDAMALEIGDKQNVDYRARVPERAPVFLIEGGLVNELDKDVSAWWSRRLLHHATTETTTVRVTTSGEERSMDRKQAQELLSALSSAAAESIVTEPPSGETAYVITVSTDEMEDEITIRLVNGDAYASRKDEGVFLRLPAEAWAAIEAQL